MSHLKVLGSWLLVAQLIVGCSSAQLSTRTDHDNAVFLEALCPARGHCEIESVLEAGEGPRGSELAVVRIRLGRPVCIGDDDVDQPSVRPYQDWLTSVRHGQVRALRELSFGTSPCIEWEISEWTYEDGELAFHYGMMGAPPASGTDMRRRHTHFRPWPLEITRVYAGDEIVPIRPGSISEGGPIFLLAQDQEGFYFQRRRDPSSTTPPRWMHRKTVTVLTVQHNY